MIAQTPNFSFAMEFLGKKERDMIELVIRGLILVPEEQ